MTDVEVDLYLSGKNNPWNLYHILQCCDQRFQKTRKRLVKLFGVWKRLVGRENLQPKAAITLY